MEFVEASDTTKVDSSQDTDYNWKSLGKLQSSLCRPMFYSTSPPPPLTLTFLLLTPWKTYVFV